MLKYRIFYSNQMGSVFLRRFDSMYRQRDIYHVTKTRLNRDRVIIRTTVKSSPQNLSSFIDYTFLYHQNEIIIKSEVPVLSELKDRQDITSDIVQIGSDETIFAILIRYFGLLKHYYDSKAFSILYQCLIIVQLFCCSDAWRPRRCRTT